MNFLQWEQTVDWYALLTVIIRYHISFVKGIFAEKLQMFLFDIFHKT